MIALVILILSIIKTAYSSSYENDMTFKVEAGARTCFFETAHIGQMLEAQYQVIDGQHGDLDISFDIMDPNGNKIMSDYKKTQNSIIKEIEVDGEYVFCFDNTFSVMNSKMVFIYILIENPNSDDDQEAVVSVVEPNVEGEQKEILEWMGHRENGEPYYIEVKYITDKLTRILKQVVKARHMLDFYGASKSRDSHMAYEDTFIVDIWSAFQITFMLTVGLIQVYMIKKLFQGPDEGTKKSFYSN